MSQLKTIVSNWKYYTYWRKKVRGEKTIDHIRDSGFYLPLGLVDINITKQYWNTLMASGRIGLYELVDYEVYDDPKDMIKLSRWSFIGYQDYKAIVDCTFDEFMEIYVKVQIKV